MVTGSPFLPIRLLSAGMYRSLSLPSVGRVAIIPHWAGLPGGVMLGPLTDGGAAMISSVSRPERSPRMITTFDSLYAGHVDMNDIGYGGAAVNSRVYPNEH